MKNIKKLIICMVIILLIVLIALLILSKKKGNKTANYNIPGVNIPEQEEIIRMAKVKEYNEYYSVINAIARYYGYYGYQDQKALLSILNSKYLDEKNINKENVLEQSKASTEFLIIDVEDMNYIKDRSSTIYYVKGIMRDVEEENFTMAVIVNNINKAFSIMPLEEYEYNSRMQDGAEVIEYNEFDSNSYNKFYNMTFSDESIATNLLVSYKKLMMNDVQKAYMLLSEEYKREKFPTLVDFKEYLDKNMAKIKVTMINQYLKEECTSCDQYTCIDQNGNKYIFELKGPQDYKVYLDEYTAAIPTYVDKYNASSNEQKAVLCVKRFLQAIDNGDYKYAYNRFTTGFKKNYFNTQDALKQFIESKNWLKYDSIKDTKVTEENNAYICEVRSNITQKFIVELLNGTDYRIAISM